MAGDASLLENVQSAIDLQGAIIRHDTPSLFGWLMAALSYQGISDQVARSYMDRHGQVTWRGIEGGLAAGWSCPKLRGYWSFHGCRYDKSSRTCAEPERYAGCPLPRFDLRNGRLNQTALSLFLFIRDVAEGDLVTWLDRQLNAATRRTATSRRAQMREAVIGPLRHVFGLSDKTLAMALSDLFLSSPPAWRRWRDAGAHMIAVDTLVHNFLNRTGILRRRRAEHLYGLGCYRTGGCADILLAVADVIDAREFNPAFPKSFPRFVQHAIWRYCARDGLDTCNGNRIDDRWPCENKYCRIFNICDKISLYN